MAISLEKATSQLLKLFSEGPLLFLYRPFVVSGEVDVATHYFLRDPRSMYSQ